MLLVCPLGLAIHARLYKSRLTIEFHSDYPSLGSDYPNCDFEAFPVGVTHFSRV